MSNSVMPKGVEHFRQPTFKAHVVQVSNSVMPKGVEHVLTGADWMPLLVCRIQ